MSADVETIVIGAGVVGLAVARALAMAGHEVMVLEQHELIGSETSSRNSEVIHAGIYYPPGSLRATLCVRGKELLYRFCAENGVAHARCGKLLVATHESQLPKLAAIRETAAKNGVTDLEPIGGNAARDLEPELACVAALISPSTGIVDSHGLMLALEGHVEANGGSVVLRCPVERIERDAAGPFRLTTGGDSAGRHHLREPRHSAGLHASKLARTLDYGDALPPARDLLRQGPVLRALRPLAVQAPHLPAARRRLARPARHRRHRRALQVRPRHRVDGGHRLQLPAREARQVPRFHPQLLSGPRREPPARRLHRASAPSSTAKASRCPTSPSTARIGTARRDWSRSTASRAPASPQRWRSARWWRRCWAVGRNKAIAALRRFTGTSVQYG